MGIWFGLFTFYTGGMRDGNKHIALVANTAWNLHHFRGGLIRALQAAGHRITAVAPPGSPQDMEALQALGVRFLPLRHLSRKGANPLQDLRLLRELTRIYRKEQIDLALHYTVKPNIYGSLAARRAGVRSICTVTGLGYAFLHHGLVPHLVRLLYRHAFRRAERVLFQNPDDRDLFLQLRLIRKENTGLVPGSGIDIRHFSPRPYPEEPPNAPFRFLFVGRLLHDKGVRELLQAVDILKKEGRNLRLELVGDVDEGNPASLSLEDTQRWDKSHRYAGPQKDLRPFYARARAVVLPSYREGLPRVLLEALSMARPVVASDVPGCREPAREGRTGCLAEARSAKSLAAAMGRLMDLPEEERRALGRNGREMVEREYAEEVVVRKYLKLIESL